MGGGGSRLDSETLSDVYIDDLVILCCSSSISAPVELTARLALADATYAALNLPVKVEKGDEGSTTSYFWGAEVRGDEGTIGAPLEKRVDLMSISLAALSRPISKSSFHQMLGSWVYVIGFRKEMLAIIENCYQYLQSMPERGFVCLPPSVVDEVLLLIFVAPLLHVYLKDESVSYDDAKIARSPVAGPHQAFGHSASKRCSGMDAIFATDAAGDGGLGGCLAPLSRKDWLRCYSCSEEYGEYTCLNFERGPEIGHVVTDRRAITPIWLLGSTGRSLSVSRSKLQIILGGWRTLTFWNIRLYWCC